jgi:hypothetical protein
MAHEPKIWSGCAEASLLGEMVPLVEGKPMRIGMALLLAVVFGSTAWAQTNFTIRFDQNQYFISPGQTFSVQVLIDPAPAHGLFSSGVELLLNSMNAQIADVSSIHTPAGLDFNAVRGPGAVKSLSHGFTAVKGTIDFFGTNAVPYSASLLASFTVTDLGNAPYTLSLGLFNTLGPSEGILVDGGGRVLDKSITFGTATVNYLPASPASLPTHDKGAIILPKVGVGFISVSFPSNDGGTVRVVWESVVGVSYRVQSKNSLSEPSWTDLPGDVVAVGPTCTKDDVLVSSPHRFYRILVLSH